MRQLSLGALLVVAPVHCGCGMFGMAKHGLTELRGAHGTVYAVTAAPSEFHESLSGIKIGKVRNTIEPVCPPDMRRIIEIALRDRAAEASAELEGSGGICTVDVDITFNKEPGGVLALIGKGALLIGRATVYGSDTRQVADLLVVVASKAMRTTADEMAEEFADTLIERIREGAG